MGRQVGRHRRGREHRHHGLPDGTYWLRAETDPYHYLTESDVSNNITDTELTIAGDAVTVTKQTHPDSTPPTVTLSSPSAGASVSGNVTLAANASGPTPIKQAQFLLDGQPLRQPVMSAPYTMTWNVGSTPPGTHYLSVQTTDSRGFVGTSADVAVNVPQPPVQIGSITVDRQVSASGNTSATTPQFSTAAGGETPLAFVGSDGPISLSQSEAGRPGSSAASDCKQQQRLACRDQYRGGA